MSMERSLKTLFVPQDFLEVVPGEDLTALTPSKLVDIETLREELREKGQHSELNPWRNDLMVEVNYFLK